MRYLIKWTDRITVLGGSLITTLREEGLLKEAIFSTIVFIILLIVFL